MQQYSGLVQAIVGSMVRDPRDVEEIVQDTFVKAINGIKSYREAEASLSTWLGRVAHHQTVDFLRKKSRQPVEVAHESLPEPKSEPSDDERVTALLLAIDRLKPDERTILTLAYDSDMPLAEIAYIFDTNANNISSKLYRIRQKLALFINEYKPD